MNRAHVASTAIRLGRFWSMLKATLGGALIAASIAAVPANASETKGFLVSWFDISQFYDTEGRNCPHGINPGPEEYYIRELKRIGTPQEEIDHYIDNFLDLSQAGEIAPMVQMRGRIDGKPVDVYANPTSVPDPNIFLVEGPHSYGFNLDGKESTGGFIDPETGEKGIDNQIFKAVGCTQEIRQHAPDEYPPLTISYWGVVVEVMPALLIEISGIDDPVNDDDVTVSIIRGQERPVRDSSGGLLAGMSFSVDPNPKWHNVLKGQIRDGVITTTPTNINIATDPFVMPEHNFTDARLRLKIQEDGTLDGKLGGYHKWFPFYWKYGVGTWGVEATNNIDLPGFYYALRKLADAYPDPETGENTSISVAFQIDAVPAFVIREEQSAQNGRVLRSVSGN
ncbi:MAG: hypothetical protein CMG46_09295 [Candidatus Marinimicrobia bacterium]|nr:hypothetical protein [Candidatus Neomarinimicrobiota bacterium]